LFFEGRDSPVIGVREEVDEDAFEAEGRAIKVTYGSKVKVFRL
jgi:hypothetical protein